MKYRWLPAPPQPLLATPLAAHVPAGPASGRLPVAAPTPSTRLPVAAPPPSARLPVAPAAPGSFVEVTGTVAYLTRIALPPDAVLVVRIQDVSRADAPARTLAEQRIELAGQQVPIPFRMLVDRDLLRKNARISVAARIQRGSALLFINDTNYPAFANGQPRHVDMVLKQVGGGKGR